MAELTSQVTFRVSDKLYRRIQEIAQHERRKPNEVARALLERGEAAYNADEQLFEPAEGQKPPHAIPLKIVGRVSGGKPIEPVEHHEVIMVLSSDVAGVQNPKALRVAGDSMRESNVMDGDIILVGDCASPINRIVVAYIEEKGTLGATLKRWRQKGQNVTLEPANPDYEPVTYPLKKLRLYGALIKVLRTFPTADANEQTEADAA
jgi:SOS-response transcriptional repressor LexA